MKGKTGGHGEKRNVKSSSFEVIMAGNLSYHSDLVKALQQAGGEREKRERWEEIERERKRESERER